MKPRNPPDRMSHLEAFIRQKEGLPEPVKPKKRHRIDRQLDEIEAGIERYEALVAEYEALMNKKK